LLLSLSLAVARRPSRAVATEGGNGSVLGLPRGTRATVAGWVLGGLALAALAAAFASTSSAAYTAALIGLLFAFAFAFTWTEGRNAVRILVGFVIVTAALRGALLGLSNAINLPDGLTVVNGIQPAIVAGSALAVLLERRGRFPGNTRPLLVGWALIAVAAILDFATQ